MTETKVERPVHLLRMPSDLENLHTLCGVFYAEDFVRHDFITGDPDICTCAECATAHNNGSQHAEPDSNERLVGLAVKDGAIQISMAIGQKMAVAFASCLQDMFDDSEAPNYLEMQLVDKIGRRYTVTVQKQEGFTPDQLKRKAEAKISEALAEIRRHPHMAKNLMGISKLVFSMPNQYEKKHLIDAATMIEIVTGVLEGYYEID